MTLKAIWERLGTFWTAFSYLGYEPTAFDFFTVWEMKSRIERELFLEIVFFLYDRAPRPHTHTHTHTHTYCIIAHTSIPVYILHHSLNSQHIFSLLSFHPLTVSCGLAVIRVVSGGPHCDLSRVVSKSVCTPSTPKHSIMKATCSIDNCSAHVTHKRKNTNAGTESGVVTEDTNPTAAFTSAPKLLSCIHSWGVY